MYIKQWGIAKRKDKNNEGHYQLLSEKYIVKIHYHSSPEKFYFTEKTVKLYFSIAWLELWHNAMSSSF